MNTRRVLLGGLALGLTACSDHVPTAATHPFSPPAALPVETVAAQTVLADARERLLPVLNDRELAGAVDRAFSAAAASLASGDPDAFRGAMDGARAALAAHAAFSPPGAAAEGDVEPDDSVIVESVELVIDLIEAAVLGEGTA